MSILDALILVYMTQLTTQAELTVQAAGYDQVTATCPGFRCEWVARSLATRDWEHGKVWCNPLTLNCHHGGT